MYFVYMCEYWYTSTMTLVFDFADPEEFEDEWAEGESELFDWDVERAEQGRRDVNRQAAYLWAAIADALQ